MHTFGQKTRPDPRYEDGNMILSGKIVMIIPDELVGLPPGEEGRRIVRHGMANILEWLGEDTGPSPTDGEAYMTNDYVFVSRRVFNTVERYIQAGAPVDVFSI